MMNENRIKAYCYLLFGLFFIIMLAIYGYGVYFLKNLGLSYISIGTTIAISALLTSIIQPILGRIVDAYHYSWQKMLIILNIIIILSLISIFFIPSSYCPMMFGIVILASGCMYPFINYSPFYFENHGIGTVFGVARGFGSLSFTVFSSIIGFILSWADFMVMPLFPLASSVVMIIVLRLIPDYGYEEKAVKRDFKKNIFRKYPGFIFIIISLVFLMTFQNLFECYMINIIENIGGNISNVGISNSLASVLELPVMFLFIKILERVSSKKLIVIASVFYVVRSLMICFSTDILGIYISQIMQMLTFAIMLPASVHFTKELIDENDQYEAQAYLGGTVTIGLIFANFIGGKVLQSYDINLLLILLVVLTVIASAFAFIALAFERESEV